MHVPSGNKALEITIADSESVMKGRIILHLKKDKATNKSLRKNGDVSLESFGIIDIPKDSKDMIIEISGKNQMSESEDFVTVIITAAS